MASRRRLLLCLISFSLLIFFILRWKPERSLIWTLPSLEYFQEISDSGDLQNRKTGSTDSPPTSISSSSVDGTETNRTKISTKPPSVKLQQPTLEASEPPIIEDTYMSEDVPPQTNCPKGVRSRVSTTEFGKRFLKSIPILQWAKHATPEQHHRLRRYSGAHGWRDVDYKTLVGALSALNTSANQQLFDDWNDRSNKSECIRCAVVGNGGILKDSRKGEEIDSHHYVFRANGAVIKGFEQDVGTRTTHYTFTAKTLMIAYRDYQGLGYRGPPLSKETRYVFLPDFDRSYLMIKAAATHTLVEKGNEEGKDTTKFFGQDVSAEKLKLLHPDFLRYIRNRFLYSKNIYAKDVRYYRPSTGAELLLIAMHTCDEVSAYGFITPDYDKYSKYYFDKEFTPVNFPRNHDFKMELNLWQQFSRAGLINLYRRA